MTFGLTNVPTVTANTANLADSSATITINGSGFSTTAASNSIVFNDGAIGTVSNATATSLTVTFSTIPVAAGTLTAVVTTNSVSSGSPVQVATVTPVVTSNTTNVAPNVATLTINGSGFSTAAASNSVTFNDGLRGLCTAYGDKPYGNHLDISHDCRHSYRRGHDELGQQRVAGPGRYGNAGCQRQHHELGRVSQTFTISGLGFDTNPAHDSVTFTNGGVTGSVSSATNSSLIVSLTGLSSQTGGAASMPMLPSIASAAAVPYKWPPSPPS